ncbi:nuclear transport factor 2 family protein [Chitinophaga lutea]|uniref:Nuclear transport factor 2 family protein n=1 Tax=Chitinophaga lutea TaxID=2488634 RepID=A0A3N4QRG9_9BACT|nr:nuclear transport factor 2 family protein [Chitinophaga lutea]RPE14174.1 nuclear transport factor 2 family protein [Chitinophaga lutea]
MKNQALQTVQQFLAAVQQFDVPQLQALLHPAVKWQAPGSNRFSGEKQNAGEVFEMVGGMMAASGNTFSLAEIKSVAVNGNRVACVLRFTASREGAVMDTDNTDVYTVENGQITAVEAFATEPEKEDAFWGK